MPNGISPDNRMLLISALEKLAATIEQSPPTVIGSDISVYAPEGAGRVVGQLTSVTAGPGATGQITGERISAVARPGQSIIGKRITVTAGGPPPPENAFQPPQSFEEVSDIVRQLRDAAKALQTSDASKPWIAEMLARVERWGSAALSGAISGAVNAVTKFYLGG